MMDEVAADETGAACYDDLLFCFSLFAFFKLPGGLAGRYSIPRTGPFYRSAGMGILSVCMARQLIDILTVHHVLQILAVLVLL